MLFQKGTQAHHMSHFVEYYYFTWILLIQVLMETRLMTYLEAILYLMLSHALQLVQLVIIYHN